MSHAHSSGRIASLDDTRWICKCGEIFADHAAWTAHRDAAEKPPVDPPGTCHLVGCPGKGQHPPHGIGVGTWDDYTKPQHCLGFPVVITFVHQLTAVCSIGRLDTWKAHGIGDEITPALMAELVDRHKTQCTNRSPR